MLHLSRDTYDQMLPINSSNAEASQAYNTRTKKSHFKGAMQDNGVARLKKPNSRVGFQVLTNNSRFLFKSGISHTHFDQFIPFSASSIPGKLRPYLASMVDKIQFSSHCHFQAILAASQPLRYIT